MSHKILFWPSIFKFAWSRALSNQSRRFTRRTRLNQSSFLRSLFLAPCSYHHKRCYPLWWRTDGRGDSSLGVDGICLSLGSERSSILIAEFKQKLKRSLVERKRLRHMTKRTVKNVSIRISQKTYSCSRLNEVPLQNRINRWKVSENIRREAWAKYHCK